MKKDFIKNKFNLIVSIGEDCACSSYLRRCGLQHYSYPFDWLTNAPFENRIELIVNDFNNFLNISDLELMQKPVGFSSDNNHDYYVNKKTQLYFWHDFPSNAIIENSFPAVFEKYQRRIDRLYKIIENSQKILFVWLSHSKLHDSNEVIKEYKKLKEKFKNKEIFLLFIENSQTDSQESYEDNHILIVHQDTTSDDKKHHYDQTMGNKTNNLRIFRKIKLKTTFFEKLKYFIYKSVIIPVNIIPSRKLRHHIKSEVNLFFYRAKL